VSVVSGQKMESEVQTTRRPAGGFEDLKVFKLAHRLALEVHRASLGFPAVEQYGLADQVRRASKSICANIAEGVGKQAGSPAECGRFLAMALGSADEMRVWLRFCLDLGYIELLPGSVGVTPIRKSRRCCKACAGASAGLPSLPPSLLTTDHCHLTTGPVAERSVGR
jgi:four helix bundle protein